MIITNSDFHSNPFSDLGIGHLESCVYYELFYYAQSYALLLSFIPKSHLFVMQLIIHMLTTSVIPDISLD